MLFQLAFVILHVLDIYAQNTTSQNVTVEVNSTSTGKNTLLNRIANSFMADKTERPKKNKPIDGLKVAAAATGALAAVNALAIGAYAIKQHTDSITNYFKLLSFCRPKKLSLRFPVLCIPWR